MIVIFLFFLIFISFVFDGNMGDCKLYNKLDMLNVSDQWCIDYINLFCMLICAVLCVNLYSSERHCVIALLKMRGQVQFVGCDTFPPGHCWLHKVAQNQSKIIEANN